MAFDFIFSGPPKLNVPVSGDTFPVTGYDIINNVMYVSTTTSGWVAVGSGDGIIDATQLQGRTISAAAPTNSQVLTWNATTNSWEPDTSASTVSLQLPTAGLASPSPVYSPNEAPSNINPVLYIQDVNGAWHQQAGIDTVTADGGSGSGPADPAGTLTWFRRMFFRDSRSATQNGKNAFLSVNHMAGVGTAQTNQDRAIWISMANVTDVVDSYSISEGILTLNMNTSPTQFLAGMPIAISGFATSKFLNGIGVASPVLISTAAGGVITLPFSHGDVSLTVEAGQLDQSIYAMEGIQMELDLVGSPNFISAVDGEIATLSLQLADSHVGGLTAPNYGVFVNRTQFYRSGGNWGSIPSGCLHSIVTNDSATSGASGQPLVNILLNASDNAACSGLRYVALSITKPNARFLGSNFGVELSGWSANTNQSDFAIYADGGQSVIQGTLGLTGLFAFQGTIVGAGSLTMNGIGTSHIAVLSPPSVGNVGTPGSTTYGYTIVVRDVNGGGITSTERQTTTGNATLDTTNYNSLEIVTPPVGASSIDVYRTTGGATQGNIGTISIATQGLSSYTYQSLFFQDKGLAGDSTTPPTGDSTGSISAAGPITPGKFTVAALPSGTEGATAYATNGLKVGESSGSGTGVPCYYSNGKWRVYSTDAQVQA